jgi:LCP family protein required for cell wall assembly
VTRFSRPLRLAALAVVVGAAGSFGVLHSTSAQERVFSVTKTASAAVEWTPDKPLYVLLLGTDARAGAGCGCSDAIHVVGIPAGGGQATMLDIPRDTRVSIPGHGTDKINAALAQGGPQLAAETISQFTGVPISYTFITDFDGLPAMIDEIGGVDINIPDPVHDSQTQIQLDPGPVHLDGWNAILFARSRHIDGGDLKRSEHQGLLILAVLGKLRGMGASPADTMKYLAILSRHTDLNGISTNELYRIARAAMSIDPTNVRNIVLPSHGATISGTSYVVADDSAPGFLADFADDAVLQSH